ncbi:ATP-dependent Clp protease proteolytic subunit-related protein 1, chloroplastic-like [Vicia villosa]|uniref:ATP-dependent Clp protease proteolytic subunit-related protein 1, chloroplastic-like n=1 Tax=Vicia villosa TaxID=3911 RepID=UPI00273B2961|nr:ATP-dependent Clp protease proteolytic subunit-related protein 1, chloroplastic-like [Vicia villosa]
MSSSSLSTPFIHHSSTLRHGTNPFPFPHATSTPKPRFFKPFSAKCSLDHIPKQFREENLKDGLMDNYKNVPEFLYGLTPSQMDMFMSSNNPIHQMSQRVTEESISSAKSYLDHSGMGRISSMDINGSSRTSMSVSMYRGGGRGGRRRRGPPDLPSILLDARICYLGMPIVPAVTELILGQLMWLDYDNPGKPVYLYINSSGSQNEKNETVGSETDAYSIADALSFVKSDIYTVNLALALGQAAMLLSLGKKGHRAVLPHSTTKIYLPKAHRSSGSVSDMWIQAKELQTTADYYVELLAKGTGKPEEEIAKDLQWTKYFQAQGAIDYGIADKIMNSMDGEGYKKRDLNEMLATRALKRGGGYPQAAPSGR